MKSENVLFRVKQKSYSDTDAADGAAAGAVAAAPAAASAASSAACILIMYLYRGAKRSPILT